MVLGSTLKDQIYKEGVPTWGLKSGVLDVEDVKKSIKIFKTNIHKFIDRIYQEGLSEDFADKHIIDLILEDELGELAI